MTENSISINILLDQMLTISSVLVLIFMSILDGGIIKHQTLSQIHYCGIKQEKVNKPMTRAK